MAYNYNNLEINLNQIADSDLVDASYKKFFKITGGVCYGLSFMYLQACFNHDDGIGQFYCRLILLSQRYWFLNEVQYFQLPEVILEAKRLAIENKLNLSEDIRTYLDLMIFVENLIFYHGEIQPIQPVQDGIKTSYWALPSQYYNKNLGNGQGYTRFYHEMAMVQKTEIHQWLLSITTELQHLSRFEYGFIIETMDHAMVLTVKNNEAGNPLYYFFDQNQSIQNFYAVLTLENVVDRISYGLLLSGQENDYCCLSISAYTIPLQMQRYWKEDASYNPYFGYEQNILMKYFFYRYEIISFIRKNIPSLLKEKDSLDEKLRKLGIVNEYLPMLDSEALFRAKELILNFLKHLISEIFLGKEISIPEFIRVFMRLDIHLELMVKDVSYKNIIEKGLRNASFGEEQLFFASKQGHFETSRLLLLNDKVEVNKKNKNGATPLMVACQNGHVETVELLIKNRGIEIDEVNEKGESSFFLACHNNFIEIVELLSRAGANINKARHNTCTPFFVACYNDRFELVEWFLKKGVNLEIKSFNLTPLGLAELGKKDKIVELIKRYSVMSSRDIFY